MLAIITLSLVLASDTEGPLNPPVRSSSPKVVAAIERGIVTSPTFAGLIDELGRQAVIVYIEPTTRLRAGLGAATMHRLSTCGGVRYVWVGVDGQWPHQRLVALIAHELQHALEIARDQSVVSGDDIDRLFERIGFCRGHQCETIAARDVEARVVKELSRD